MERIAPKYRPVYDQEIKNLFLQRSFIFFWLGIVFFPLFSLLDSFAAREHFAVFLAYRVCLAFILLLFLIILHRVNGHLLTLSFTLIAYLLGGLTITLMVLKTGGYSSAYYVGLLLISVGGFALLPLTIGQAAFAGFCLYCVYAVPVFMFSRPTADNLKIFFTNSFFFLAIIMVSLVQCKQETKARMRKFKLNMNLKSLNEDLSFYTHNLEDEVGKRVKKIEESELHYKELYENILDLIVLIDSNAKILVANQHFYSTIGRRPQTVIGMSLLNIVHADNLSMVVDGMLPRLFQGEAVKDFQFVIQGQGERLLDVECNAKKILKEGRELGFQLIIRDITERKKMEKKLLESYRLIDRSRTTAILALAKLAEFRDKDTGCHLERIREYSKILAAELAKQPSYQHYITREYIDDIYLSSILHDIGKVGIPDYILLKPGKLTMEEYETMKCHSVYGGDALCESEKQTAGQSFLTIGKQIAYYHHEKWDGSGYPNGLAGPKIPLSARIVALADAYDALTSQRCYKSAISHERAKEIIIRDAGIHFDPDVVEAFLAQEHAFQQARLRIIIH
ncbi:MAG: PAS domain S-box protein [Deltaproteobacteria bacterium]|nr:PAS domain S-box protein [Deltaproteobacteria bacterium]